MGMLKMKEITACLCLIVGFTTYAQMDYEPNDKFPYGRPNPKAPKELMDFDPLIGTCNCKSVTRVDQTTWADTVDMVWRWKYIMNGMGVQDETFQPEGPYNGSIRQYNSDSSSWYVHFYSSTTPTPSLSSWEGGKNDDGNIILYNEQKAPNGWDGFFKITFSDIKEEGFNWLGEWVSLDESIKYATWRIYCKKE